MTAMEPKRDPAIMARMRMTFDLYETAEAMMRQNLRRRHPGASEAEIERLLVAWLRHRPGAEHGDAVGRPSRRFETTE
jgi:Rv0078B-related antitoxin